MGPPFFKITEWPGLGKIFRKPAARIEKRIELG